MFKRIDDADSAEITFDFEGEAISARAGESVAAALLASNKLNFRDTPVAGRPRGPFCMMGVCFDCLMIIDGTSNVQACQVTALSGMKVERQSGAAMISPDGTNAEGGS